MSEYENNYEEENEEEEKLYVLLRRGGPYENFGNNHMEFMIYNMDGLNQIVRDYGDEVAPGSIARTAGYFVIFEKDLDGNWTLCVDEENSYDSGGVVK